MLYCNHNFIFLLIRIVDIPRHCTVHWSQNCRKTNSEAWRYQVQSDLYNFKFSSLGLIWQSKMMRWHHDGPFSQLSTLTAGYTDLHSNFCHYVALVSSWASCGENEKNILCLMWDVGGVCGAGRNVRNPELCPALSSPLLYQRLLTQQTLVETQTRHSKHANMSAKTSLVTFLLLASLAPSLASVAIGLGRLNPGNDIEWTPARMTYYCSGRWLLPGPWQRPVPPPGGVLEPPLHLWPGQVWRQPRQGPHLLLLVSNDVPPPACLSPQSLSCGAATAGEGCYLKRDLGMPYPYCCPRSFCPSNRITDIFSNSLEADYEYPEEQLQMAASHPQANRVMVAPPAQYEVSLDNDNQEYEDYDWDKIFGGFFK